MVIIVTDAGLEVDGILLSNTAEIQTFIDVHTPQDLNINISPIPPSDLTAHIGAHLPFDFPIELIASSYHPMSDLYTYISVHVPADFTTLVGAHLPHNLNIPIGAHSPRDITFGMVAVPYVELDIIIDWIVHQSDINTVVGSHIPYDLGAYFNVWNISNIQVRIGTSIPKDLCFILRAFGQGNSDLTVRTAATHTSCLDFSYIMYVWGAKDFQITIGTSIKHDLSLLMQTWHIRDVNVCIDTVFPKTLEMSITPIPEEGYDLNVIHRIHQKVALFAEFNIWEGISTLSATLLGLYPYDLSVGFTMGSYSPLYITLPMTTGYKDLVVTLKSATRIMSTIITVYTMEIKDLYVSINQGWPCGFGSSYMLLEVVLNPKFFLNFTALIRAIDGSGSAVIANYVNKPYFDTFIAIQKIQISLPEDQSTPEAIIVDKTDLTYENQFYQTAQDVVRVRFPWPRFRRIPSYIEFSVILTPFHGNTYADIMVYIHAVRPESPRMPTSRPLILREGMGASDPIWPDIFQVKEIELWSDDMKDLVRKIDITFGEQIREYYWVSSEQRAYSKNMWETKWTILGRGYLPHTEYSGQIDYVTMREISDMKKYNTIDEAIRALISNFLYSGKSDIQILIGTMGYYSELSVMVDIRGRDRFTNLRVYIEPMRACDLTITLQCQ